MRRMSSRVALAVVALSAFSLAQSGNDAQAALSGGNASYIRVSPKSTDAGIPGQFTISSSTVLDAVTGQVVGGGNGHVPPNPNANANHTLNSNIDWLDSLPTFDAAFVAQAGPSDGSLFRFTMIGNHPRVGGTTKIPSKMSEVSLQLLAADGSVFKNVPYAPFEMLTLDSPNFQPANYRSGMQVQLADAIQRATFYNRMGPNWHTTLVPQIVNRVTITVPFFVNVQLPNGSVVQARSYFSGTAPDGSTFVLMLEPLFDFFFDNEVVSEIVAGNFTTDALNTTLFPNTYLFGLNVNNPNTPGSCCVLGFHTYFWDGPSHPQSRWVTQYASWISPGLFGGGFQDITALSHETSEAFNDPFVDNATPNWQFPGVPPTAKVCQNNLETGDPVEVLSPATVPITLKETGQTFTFHPQTEVLLQWFEMGDGSNAIDGAFSFPNESTVTHSALPCPQ